MTELEKEIAHLQELQAKHQKNIRTLEEMLAGYGMERPLHLVNSLDFEREQLCQVEERLAELTGQAETEEVPGSPVEPAVGPRGVQVSVTGSGAAAVGERATSAGEGGVAVGGDVVYGDKVGGDKVAGDKVEVSTYVRDVHGGTVIAAGRDVTYTERPPEPGRLSSKALMEVYLGRLVSQTSRLELSGVDRKAAADGAQAELALAEVYTALDTLAAEQPEPERLAARMEREEVRRLSAIAALNRYSRLVLLGDPGSGKSTFVNFVTLCLAGERLGLPEAGLERLGEGWQRGWQLPVRIVLRDLAARGLPPPGEPATGDHLGRFIAAELGETLADFAPLLKKHLLEQGGLILLDGLDEVPEASRRREQVKDAVTGFARDFGRCRFLVTSRTYAYQKQDWKLPGFAETVLAPFNDEQVAAFVDRWYDHMAAVRANLGRDEALGRAELLKHAIKNTPRLAELAARPLLLTLMASLHAWRGGSLPDKREELYADCVDLLLDVWERPKVVRDASGQPMVLAPSVAEWLRAPRERVRAVLDELAFVGHRDQPSLQGTADIEEGRLVGALLRAAGNPDLKPGRVVEYVRDRAGLLAARGEGVYAFPHRTFQEYLAACHLTGRGFPDELAALVRADAERWREVALLAAAKAARGAPYAAWALAEALCPCEPPAEPEDAGWWAALLAAQGLVEAGLHEQPEPQHVGKVARLQCWLVRLVEDGALPPVDRAAAGDALARLGDPRPGVGLREDGLPDVVWCEVPAGLFVMGTRERDIPALLERYGGEREWYEREVPQHRPNLPAYSISKYPVTNAQYATFVQDGGYQERRYWAEAGWQWKEDSTGPRTYGGVFDLPNHPVVGVTWYEAVAFCRWLTERLRETGDVGLDQEVTLPTEAQWEKAARGEDGHIFPWGDEFDAAKCNVYETSIGTTSAAGIFPAGASPYGVLDLSGNVWEWCRTRGRDSYREPSDEALEGDAPRVLRGGAFGDGVRRVRCAVRIGYLPNGRLGNIGFRVCVVSQQD